MYLSMFIKGVALHHHLANIVQSQQLQPLVRALSLVLEGKVLHHVQASHRHPQQEERDLRQLPPSNQQAPGKVIVHAIVFSQTIFSLFSISVRKKDCCSQTNPDFVCLMILHYVHMKQSVANKAATT